MRISRPEFPKRVEEGAQIIVAGRGFGSGSSRKDAVKALKLIGIKAVIAKSFAYIYNRNRANIALFGIVVEDDEFYQAAQEGSTVSVLVAERKVAINGRIYPFKLEDVVLKLQISGGILNRWMQHGKDLFRRLQMDSQKELSRKKPVELTILYWPGS